ncbi:NADPH:quinone oxidoreductase family protein [Flavisphingomonas formosensis]|uniref:NADPH:quinone oxidoreductase family protein n=1 Tax=Flavisphingomonas formosensis TaxID=861534 RepID=UPI0012FAC7DE|nr:NADPH:quinone oxidoreductase family protein [Sphingomonas formosensis]
MRAILCERHGPPERLALRDIPPPEPAPGEVRLRVQAASVNFPDALIIQNLYQTKPPLPFGPGSEAAGFVDAVGEGVGDFHVGDRVAAMTTFGAFAEQVAVPAARVLPLPETMSFEVASGFTVVYGTAIHAFEQRAALRSGETVLVLGAAGGVGLAAIEVARAMGARVIAAASSEEKLALARRHGADGTIDYSREDLRAGIRRIAGDRGVDVVFDPVGGALAEPAFRSIERNGRYLVVGFAAGDIPSIPLNLPLVKSAAIIGVFWGSFVVADPEAHRRNAERLYDWHARGLLVPEISRRFPLEETAAAIRWVMDRKALGKVVVTIGEAG